jgi:hypothetical protein
VRQDAALARDGGSGARVVARQHAYRDACGARRVRAGTRALTWRQTGQQFWAVVWVWQVCCSELHCSM